MITGIYVDASFVYHGYLRSPEDKFATVDPLGSAGTFPQSINDLGIITGSYIDTNNVYHGFLSIVGLSSPVQGTSSLTFISNQTHVEVDGEIYPSGITITENTNLNHTVNAYPSCAMTSVSGLNVVETRPNNKTGPWTEATGKITASPVIVICQ